MSWHFGSLITEFNGFCGIFCSMPFLTRHVWKPLTQRQLAYRNALSPPSRKPTLFQKVLKKPKKRWGKLFSSYLEKITLYFFVSIPSFCLSLVPMRIDHISFYFCLFCRDFAKSITRPFSVYFNPYTQSIEILKDTRSIENVVQDLRSDLNTVCDALNKMNQYLGIWCLEPMLLPAWSFCSLAAIPSVSYSTNNLLCHGLANKHTILYIYTIL